MAMRPDLTTRKGSWSPVVLALLVALVGVAAWLVLRQPAWRAWLIALVPQRPGIEQAAVRRILAPRSVLLAGVCIAALTGLCWAIPGTRQRMARTVSTGGALMVLFALVQVLVAVAVVINLHAYFLRQYHRPVGLIPAERVLSYTVPQAWPDSRALLRQVPRDARIGLKVNGPDLFLLPALAYPVAFYEAYPADASRPNIDPAFEAVTASRELTHILEYRPMDRANPFDLRPLSLSRRTD
jgi:hypothetical protein